MAKEKHTYRKGYQHQFEAEGSADGFKIAPSIDKAGPNKSWVQEEDGTFYVYVELEGELDPAEVFDATGFERVS